MPIPKMSVVPRVKRGFVDGVHFPELDGIDVQHFIDTFLSMNAFTLNAYYRIYQSDKSFQFMSDLTSPLGKHYVIFWTADVEFLFPSNVINTTEETFRSQVLPTLQPRPTILKPCGCDDPTIN